MTRAGSACDFRLPAPQTLGGASRIAFRDCHDHGLQVADFLESNGMNFDTAPSPLNMPELTWRYGYLAFWIVAPLVVAGMLIFFRRKGWEEETRAPPPLGPGPQEIVSDPSRGLDRRRTIPKTRFLHLAGRKDEPMRDQCLSAILFFAALSAWAGGCQNYDTLPDGGDGGPDAFDGASGDDGDGTAAGDDGVLDSCVAGVAPDNDWGFLVIQDFREEAGGGRLRIVLEPGEGNVVGEAIPYHLTRFALELGGESFCILEKADMSWENGHHNWNDTGRARRDGIEYLLRLVLDTLGPGGWNDTLEARVESSGATVFGPLKLADAGCRTVPPGNPNACLFRTRTDQ